MSDDNNQERPQKSMLGFQTDQLAGLTETDLVNNSIAIRMMLHYYKQMSDENHSLKNTNNTLQTYATAYERKKSDTTVAAVLLILSNIAIGFGTNILTTGFSIAGTLLFVMGVLLSLGAVFFNFFKEKI